MTGEPVLRPARREDSRAIAELYRMAGDGVADYVWTQLAEPGESVLGAGTRRFARDDEAYSYQNCLIAEIDGKIAGMIHSYVMGTPDPDWDPETVEAVLRPYAELEAPDSLYIAGVACYPEYRGRGLGTKLIARARERTRELGCTELSLIVFEQNESAVRLYQRLGFAIADRRAVVPHKLIHHTGEALLMVARVD